MTHESEDVAIADRSLIDDAVARAVARAPDTAFVFELMLVFGLTVFEAAALERRHVDSEARWLQIVDGPRSRRIYATSADQQAVLAKFLRTKTFHRISTVRGRVSRMFHEFVPPGISLRDVRTLGKRRLQESEEDVRGSVLSVQRCISSGRMCTLRCNETKAILSPH